MIRYWRTTLICLASAALLKLIESTLNWYCTLVVFIVTILLSNTYQSLEHGFVVWLLENSPCMVFIRALSFVWENLAAVNFHNPFTSKMDQVIYSEAVLKFDFGKLNFSLTDETIYEKLARIPKCPTDCVTERDITWSRLYQSLIKKSSNVEPDDIKLVEMDVSNENLEGMTEVVEMTSSTDEENLYEELVTQVSEKCHEMSKISKSEMGNMQESLTSLVEDLDRLKESCLKSVMTKAWAELNSDGSKMAFCILFSFNPKLCKVLCVHILLPWMSEKVPSKMEELSKVLSKEGDIVCQYLIAPLLQIEDGPLVKDIPSLEDLLSAMSRKQCSILLNILISDGFELQQWNIPVLALILDNANPTNEDLQNLTNLVSGVGNMFAQSRNFGFLLVSIVNSIKPDSGSIVSQMNVVVNNYKGSLKYKALRVLSDLTDK